MIQDPNVFHVSGRGPNQANRGCTRAWLRIRYNRLWSGAIIKIRAGEVELDRLLQQRVPDERRGLTVVAWPPLAVRKSAASFLEELRELEPDPRVIACRPLI